MTQYWSWSVLTDAVLEMDCTHRRSTGVGRYSLTQYWNWSVLTDAVLELVSTHGRSTGVGLYSLTQYWSWSVLTDADRLTTAPLPVLLTLPGRRAFQVDVTNPGGYCAIRVSLPGGIL